MKQRRNDGYTQAAIELFCTCHNGWDEGVEWDAWEKCKLHGFESLQKIQQPFTVQQATALNTYQECGKFHPFTCPNHDVETVLVALPGSLWICSDLTCGYQQGWAWEWMTDPEMLR